MKTPLNDFLTEMNISVWAWAAKQGFPAPRLADHCKWEKDSSSGRPMGQSLALKVAQASGGHLRFSDLRPDKFQEARAIMALEASQG